ncbi:MAG: HD domain-containing phosphohydrolase [Acidobacteriota bacterium]
MDSTRGAEELVKRLGAAIRASSLYAPTHPIVSRSVEILTGSFEAHFTEAPTVTIGFLGSDVIVGRTRLRNPALSSIVRHFRDRRVDKVSFSRDMGVSGLRSFVAVMAERSAQPVFERLAAVGVKGIGVGTIAPEEAMPIEHLGLSTAQRVYGTAVSAAESVWGAATAGEEPDPAAARTIIDALATAVSQDRTSMMALTSLKSHDTYTFTHMVNVSLLTMAQARTLGITGPLLREFGLAGLMHDIGKVKTPAEILGKPGRLTGEEMDIMKRHVVDGAQILRRTPEMPSLAAVVAFEHHLKQDLSGYPERIGHRTLNLCTMLVSIADVFDALRTKRAYRDELPAARVRVMLDEQSGTTFESTLLQRFVTLMGAFPVGTLVRLELGEVGVVIGEHARDPFRPKVKIVLDRRGYRLPEPLVVDTSDRDARGRFQYSVMEAVNQDDVGVDPITVLAA